MIRRPPCQPSACSNCVRPQSVQEHFGHALVEAWLLAADRLTDEGDGREDFSSRNVVARVPAVYRSGEERLERRLEPVQELLPAGTPEQVNVHDFPDKELGTAIPYGIYDVSAGTGWVSVGTDHDTSAFAVSTLRTWWA